MDEKKLCQRCEKRPGGKWKSHKDYTWLCGPCKIRVKFPVSRANIKSWRKKNNFPT